VQKGINEVKLGEIMTKCYSFNYNLLFSNLSLTRDVFFSSDLNLYVIKARVSFSTFSPLWLNVVNAETPTNKHNESVLMAVDEWLKLHSEINNPL